MKFYKLVQLEFKLPMGFVLSTLLLTSSYQCNCSWVTQILLN